MPALEDNSETEVEFCGETYRLETSKEFVIGREGDLILDDNPYLHRRCLNLKYESSMWWLENVGTRLSATVSDVEGRFQAWLAPESRIPIVFEMTRLLVTAGPTTYEINISTKYPKFDTAINSGNSSVDGTTTIGEVLLTPDQKLMLVALCEPLLRASHAMNGTIPTSAQGAERLSWSVKKFERKLDNVCQKFHLHGVKGLYGNETNVARDRKSRLVEYALSSRLVVREDLDLLP